MFMKRSKEYNLDSILKRNLAHKMSEGGFDMKGLSLRAGLGQTAVRDILASTQENHTIQTINKLATALDTTARALLYGADNKIPMRGKIMAGLRVKSLQNKFLTVASASYLADGAEAYEFENDDNAPLAYKGWKYITDAPAKKDFPTGERGPFVVQIMDGDQVIRKIIKGATKGRFTLVHPVTQEVTEDVEIEWCAKIRHIITA